MSNFEKVCEFMNVVGQPVAQDIVEAPSIDILEFRNSLIDEESQELRQGMGIFASGHDKYNMVEVADALADILYVVYGTAAALGLPIDIIFQEVHRSNISKLMKDGSVAKRADGKILKGPQYSPPNIRFILDMYREQRKSGDVRITSKALKSFNR